ncbi:MAG: hypothetical protein H6765_03915 [Candidatus Peribacteria bacterium]|nr:MAG: hypothetical protein H6765_03915 [Candidatus Peribacteria bacterium]
MTTTKSFKGSDPVFRQHVQTWLTSGGLEYLADNSVITAANKTAYEADVTKIRSDKQFIKFVDHVLTNGWSTEVLRDYGTNSTTKIDTKVYGTANN